MDPFWSRFEEWRVERESPDLRLRDALLADYRNAWRAGDREDRYAVIEFLRRERVESGFDLMIDGVRSSDAKLALHAVANVLSLVSDGASFDREMTVALEDYARRFVDSRVLIDVALRRIAQHGPSD